MKVAIGFALGLLTGLAIWRTPLDYMGAREPGMENGEEFFYHQGVTDVPRPDNLLA